MSWCAAKVTAAKTAEKHLREQGFEVWPPYVEVRAIERGLVVRARRLLFGPYIFVRLDLAGERWRSVNGTRGVDRLLPLCSERPTPVAEGVVESWQEREAAGEFTLSAAVEDMLGYELGDVVDVRRGPLGGLLGELVWQRGDHMGLIMALLGRRTMVTVSKSAVDPKPVEGRSAAAAVATPGHRHG